MWHVSSRLSSEDEVVGVVLGEERVVLQSSLVTAGATPSVSELCCGSWSESGSSSVEVLSDNTYSGGWYSYTHRHLSHIQTI